MSFGLGTEEVTFEDESYTAEFSGFFRQGEYAVTATAEDGFEVSKIEYILGSAVEPIEIDGTVDLTTTDSLPTNVDFIITLDDGTEYYVNAYVSEPLSRMSVEGADSVDESLHQEIVVDIDYDNGTGTASMEIPATATVYSMDVICQCEINHGTWAVDSVTLDGAEWGESMSVTAEVGEHTIVVNLKDADENTETYTITVTVTQGS